MSSNLRVHPVKHYRTPSYPTLQSAVQTPELLQPLPKRWQMGTTVGSLLASLTMLSAAGCGAESPASSTGESTHTSKTDKKIPSMIAPLFEHGDGTGTFGCVSVAPPVFFSESEALAIIKNEAKAAGIDLNSAAPNAYTLLPESSVSNDKKTTFGTPVGLEAYDSKTNIAVTFISQEEGTNQYEGYAISADTARTKERAQQVMEAWKEQKVPHIVGTFYDPGVSAKDKTSEQAYKLAEQELRAQVKDFIEWLQGQGVI